MRPFDLEAAKRGEPIQTRNGKPARFIAHAPEAQERQRLIVLVNYNIYTFGEDGRYFHATSESDFDLFMAPKKRTVWVNAYQYTTRMGNDAKYFDTEDEANKAAQLFTLRRIGNRAWPLEIEE